jgi:gliding motility-associated-like protein
VKLKITNIPTCLSDSATRVLNIEKLNIIASPDQTIDEGQSVQLNVSGGGTVFNWQPPTWLNNSNISNPKATPLDNVRYIVTARNEANCTDVDTVNIKINFKSHIFIPSAFTPNNDGLNDILKPVLSLQYKLQSFSVYNRWGQIVFTTANYGSGWNGKTNNVMQPAGVYIWMLRATDRDDQPINRKGTFVLIR